MLELFASLKQYMAIFLTTIISLLLQVKELPLRQIKRYRHRLLVRDARRRRSERIGALYHKLWELESQAAELRGEINQLDWQLVFTKGRLDKINRYS